MRRNRKDLTLIYEEWVNPSLGELSYNTGRVVLEYGASCLGPNLTGASCLWSELSVVRCSVTTFHQR